MRVLVVEDDDDKRERLVAFLERTYEGVVLSSARSYQSGLRAVLEGHADLILLDMTMRNFDRSVQEEGGRPHAFAGREILRQMRRHRIETPVLVVTHFDRFGEKSEYTTLQELEVELSSRFPNYLGTVQFKGNIDDWEISISNIVGEWLKGRGN